MSTSVRKLLVGGAVAAAGGGLLFACQATTTKGTSTLVTGDAASKVYVAPGQHDEYYSFMSGGLQRAGRRLRAPVGAPHQAHPRVLAAPGERLRLQRGDQGDAETSYGFVPWDDSHHPELSQTAGEVNGKWLFINANNTPRVARIDLTTFETSEIVELPNAAGGHASPFTTPDGRYVVSATRFSVPIGENTDVGIDTYKQNFKGTLSFIRADEPGRWTSPSRS
jgi:nitrous-oxide reductase